MTETGGPAVRRMLLAVFILALAVRVWFALTGGVHPAHHWDSAHDVVIARNLAEGHGFVNEPGHPTAYRYPLVPVVLSGFFRVFGERYRAFWLFQALLGALACSMAAWLAQRAAGPSAGWLAGLLTALNAELVRYTGMILTETVFAFLLLVTAVLCTLAIRRRGRSLLLYGALVGVALGLTSLCRPVALAWGALLALPLLLWRERSLPVRLGTAATMILAAAAVISPWLVRNARVMGGPVLATSGGVTIWKLAYNDEEMAPPDGAAPEYMEVNRLARPRELALNGGDPARMTPIYNMEPRYQILMYPEEVRSRIGPEMGEVEADREFSRMAMEYVREHPLQVARHMVEGFLKTLMATEMDGRVNVVLVLMLPFLLLGAFRLQTRAPGASLVVLSCLASMLAVHMAFYFDHRFRVPYEAFMAIPAAAGMAAVWQGGLSLREKVMLFGWAALVAVANRPYIFGPQSG